MVEERIQRKLAAIVATDMVGYSRLMENDEAGTLARQKTIQTELIDPKLKEYGGRVVKTTGDGALIEFPSAVDAVLCAVAIQREMPGREVSIPEDRRIAYRIGINLGEIIYDDDDIFGDGVNVASRLEGLAESGGIHISEAVFRNIKGKLDLGFADLGPQKVKNLAEPISTFQVLLDPADVGKLISQKRKRPERKILAIAASVIMLILLGGFFFWDWVTPEQPSANALLVLPLKTENLQSTQLADAATENLIASFSRLKGLNTAPHPVSMAYKGINLDPNELSSEMGVRYVLDGFARLKGGQIELSLRLRDFQTSGDVVWEQVVTGEPKQFFGLLATLKQGVAGVLNVTLDATERDILETRPTENLEAFLAFSEAERFRYSGNFFELEKTLPLYQEALELDNKFVEALVGYADVNFTIWQRSYNTIRHTLAALDETKRTVARILELDAKNPRALGIQIGIKIENAQWDIALSEARGAVFLQPDAPWLRNVLGQALIAVGMYDDANDEFANYERLSPHMNSSEKRELAFNYLVLGDSEKALNLLNSIPPQETNRIDQYFYLAIAHAQLGEIETAKIHMAKFLEETVWNNLRWQEGYFGRYSDPRLFENWAAALTAAGLPASPYNFEKGRDSDKLLHDDLVELYSDKYVKIMAVGPFGMPYREEKLSAGVTAMYFGWMHGQRLTSNWTIRGDQYCHSSPETHIGREKCNNVYIDRERSTNDIKYVSNVYSFGVFELEFRRVGN
jgi:adenylate cyclase